LGGGATLPRPAGDWRCRFWSNIDRDSTTLQTSQDPPYGGQKLELHACLWSTESFAPHQLGLEVQSEVGWWRGIDFPDGHWGQGDTVRYPILKQVFCKRCQQIVSLDGAWTTCPRCGSDGSMHIRPVEPELITTTVDFGLS
jgi:hypothetical protein